MVTVALPFATRPEPSSPWTSSSVGASNEIAVVLPDAPFNHPDGGMIVKDGGCDTVDPGVGEGGVYVIGPETVSLIDLGDGLGSGVGFSICCFTFSTSRAALPLLPILTNC